MLKLNHSVFSDLNKRAAHVNAHCSGVDSATVDMNASRPVFLVNAYLYITSIACLIALALNLFYIPNQLVATLDAIALLVSVTLILDLKLNCRVQRAIYGTTANFFLLFISLAYLTQGEGFALI